MKTYCKPNGQLRNESLHNFMIFYLLDKLCDITIDTFNFSGNLNCT